LNQEIDELTVQVREWETKCSSLTREQEELLVIIARLEIENNDLKKRLGMDILDEDQELT